MKNCSMDLQIDLYNGFPKYKLLFNKFIPLFQEIYPRTRNLFGISRTLSNFIQELHIIHMQYSTQ